MQYSIYRGTTVILTIEPDTNSRQIRRVMAENIVNFSFTLPYPVDLALGDYITVYGETYYLNTLPVIEKNDTEKILKYSYNLTFEAKAYDLAKIAHLFLDENNQLKTVDFSLMGDADTHLNLLLRNANRDQTGWVKGTVDATETLPITFSGGAKCLGALSTFAQDFKTEWWIDGQTIHLTKRIKSSGLVFEYGKGKGLYALTRTNLDNTNVVTRLIVEGGEQNLPGEYRNYRRRLQLPIETGWALEKNVDKFGVIEHSIIFDDIYPNRIGTVTAVKDIYTFSDTTLEFDLNDHLLPGVGAKIVFNTGPIAGWEFEINNFDNTTKTFTINPNADEKALEVPSDLLHMETGDRYVLLGITLPEQYITERELDLQAAAQEYLDKNSVPRVMYAVEPDRIYFKRMGITLTLGDTVNIKDEPLGVDVTPRIVSYERDLHDRYYYPRIELSEHVNIAARVRQNAEQERVNKAVLKSDIVKPNPMATPVKKDPVIKRLELSRGFTAFTLDGGDNPELPPPVYWKDPESKIVYFSGVFYQNQATAPFSAFTLPLGYRPWYAEEVKTQVQITVGFNAFVGWGVMTIKKNGEVYITGTWPDGKEITPNQVTFVNLSGASFYTGLSTTG